MFTCLLDEGAVFRGAGLQTGPHHVDSVDTEQVLVAHDEVGHHAVGASVAFINCVPFL